MASLTLRSIKGVPLTNAELDANFTALNTELGQKLVASSNLSDLANAATARTNLGLGSVENKSSATIRSELTSLNVTTALGFTPYNATNPSGYITASASITGNAASATRLINLRTINGVGFDGTANITVADATKLPLSGGTVAGVLIGNGGFANVDGGIRIANPGGASYATSASTVTGAIKIRLPAAALGSNSMISFRVRVYQYSTGLTQEFVIAGYNYSDAAGTWYNVSALNLSDAGGDFTVRFGKDATSQCVYIGELNSSWSYPQVHVVDFSGGYSGMAASTWATDWNISFETSAFAGVTSSRTAWRSLSAGNYNSYAPSLTGTGASGTWGISITGSAATLTTGRTIALTGDVTYTSGSFNGSANVTGTATLAASGVTAGTYTKVTVDAKGRVTAGASLASADLPTYTGTLTSGQITTGLGFTPASRAGATFTGAIAVSGESTFYNGTYVDPDSGVGRAIKVGALGIAVLGGIKTDTLNSTGAITQNGSQVLHAGNYNTYAPTLTGTGASGTWGIAITGTAANASQLGGISSNRAILKRRSRIHSDDSTSLNTSIVAPEMGFTYGGSGEPAGPFVAFGGLGGDIDYSMQLVGAYSGGGNQFVVRTRNGDTNAWNAWRTIITDGNYNNYSPTLTGTGASGSWGISVTGSSASTTGNAATATALQTARTIGGVSFNGTANINLPGVNAAGNQNTTGTAAGLTDNSAWMLNRGSVASTSIDTATLNGFYTQTNVGDSQGLLVFNAGGSLGPLQMTFTYGGLMQFRGKTDSTTWTPWKTVVTSANVSTYALPIGGGTLTGAYLDFSNSSPSLRITSGPGTFFIGDDDIVNLGSGAVVATPSSRIANGVAILSTHAYATSQGDNKTHFGYYNGTSYVNYIRGAATYFDSGTLQIAGNQALHAGNYNSYSPTLTGTGASGSWGISITGNAATVTNGLVSTGSYADPSWITSLASSKLTGTIDNARLNGGTYTINVTGNAGTATTLQTARSINNVSFNGSANITIPRLLAIDDRTAAPADGSSAYLTFGFGSWNNNNTSPYADFMLMRSYTDSSGGNDNMVAFRKDAIGMRLWQGGFGSATAFGTVVDVLHSGNFSSYALPLSGGTVTGQITGGLAAGSQGLDFAVNDNYASMRVIRNNSAGPNNRDGMYIGYQNSNSGLTRIFGGGSGSGGIQISGSGVNDVTIAGNTAINAGNYTSYSPSLSGNYKNIGVGGLYSRYNYNESAWITDATSAFTLSPDFGTTTVAMHNGHGHFGDWATTLTMSGYERYGAYQISGWYNATTPQLAIRNYNQSLAGWTSWTRLLSAANFSSYALPLSGGTLTGGRPIEINTSGGGVFIRGSAGGWATGLYFRGSDNAVKAAFGSLGGDSSLSYLWAGPEYNNTWMTWSSSAVNSQVALQQGGNQVLHAGNYTSYSPSLTGSGASGSWGISVTGSAATLTTTRTLWGQSFNGSANVTGALSSVTTLAMSGQLTNTVAVGTAPFVITSTTRVANLNVATAGTADTLTTARTINGVSFNGSANITIADSTKLATTGGTLTGALTIQTAAPILNFIETDQTSPAGRRRLVLDGNGFTLRRNTAAEGNFTTEVNDFSVDASSNFVATGNVTAYSDESLKKDWAPVAADFIERLATLKSGTYTRIDSGERQAGSSAQDWKRLLPEVVQTSADGILSLAYGNAALVSAIELAKDNRELRARIERLEALVEKLIGD